MMEEMADTFLLLSWAALGDCTCVSPFNTPVLHSLWLSWGKKRSSQNTSPAVQKVVGEVAQQL